MSSRQTQTQAIHTQTNKTHKYTNISPLFIVKPCFLTHPAIHIIFNYKLTKNGLKKFQKKHNELKIINQHVLQFILPTKSSSSSSHNIQSESI